MKNFVSHPLTILSNMTIEVAIMHLGCAISAVQKLNKTVRFELTVIYLLPNSFSKVRSIICGRFARR